MSKMDENFSFKYYGYDRSMSSVTEIPWSQKKAPLSVKLDIADNPVLSFYNYAQSYRTAAHLIAERMLAEAQIDELDNYFFPVFFMYRHSVELLLKCIGFKVIPSKSDRIQFMKDTFHDLLAITKYILARTTIKRPQEEEKWLLDYFRNIASFDKESDSFRYPFHIVRDDSNNDLFHFKKVFSSQTHIDLVGEANKMEAAFEIIDMWYHDFIETGIDHRATEYRVCSSSFLDKGGSYYEQSVVGHNPYVLDFYPYYTGYKECANYIMKYVTSDIRIDIEKGLTPQHISDNKAWLFYPMCYLYRNAIELLQKSIIIEFSDISVTEICKLIRDKKHSICGLYTFIEKEIYCLYEIDPADNYTMASYLRGEKMESIWTKTVQLPSFEPLRENMKTDVLIIGGGLAGLLCARRLAHEGVDYALVEADTLCSGITKNTTAKITSQHGLIYDALVRKKGIEKARLYLEANQRALQQYRDLCQGIDCDFEEQDAFVYALDNRRKIDKELDALHKLNFDASFEKEVPLPFSVSGAVRFPHQAQFHPLKFAAGIAKGLRIYEHAKVHHLMPGKAITNNGTIAAKKIIVATHFPLLNKHGGYFIKLYQHRSYVLALKNAPSLDGMYVDEDEKGLSFRCGHDLLLLGGGSHRSGKHGGNWHELEHFAKLHYPKAEIVARWATQDCMTLDSVPYIGQYATNTPDLFVAAGFNKWGMTSSMVAADILTDLVQEKDNHYADVFNPCRSILHPQLFLNAVETTINLLTPTMPRCPHMGCALKYNKAEHSWDCPCHGSRFTEDGTLIDNPATDDKRM